MHYVSRQLALYAPALFTGHAFAYAAQAHETVMKTDSENCYDNCYFTVTKIRESFCFCDPLMNCIQMKKPLCLASISFTEIRLR